MTDVDRRHAAINGDQMPLLAVSNSDNGTFPALGPCAFSNPLSPATVSPNTPVSAFAPDVKIDIDYTEQESDARSEPIPLKPIDTVPKLDDASTVPQVGTPVDPGMCETSGELTTLIIFSASIPINPPSGTPPPPPSELLKDVQMSEEPLPNGSHHDGPNGDIIMNDARVTTSPTPDGPPDSSIASADGSQTDALMSSHPSPDDHDEDKPRPAKRARMHSDADQASLAHVSSCHFLYASMGVLIQPVLCITSIKVCHSSPCVSCVQCWYPTSHHYSCPNDPQSLDVDQCPIPLLFIDDSFSEENEGCRAILATSRSYCSQYPPLSANHQESHGLCYHRAKTRLLQSYQARHQPSESPVLQCGRVHIRRSPHLSELLHVQWSGPCDISYG